MQIYSFQLNNQKLLSFNAANSIDNKHLKILKSLEDTFTKNNKKIDNINNLYKKYFGDILPFENIAPTTDTVFNEKLEYNEIGKGTYDRYENDFKRF